MKINFQNCKLHWLGFAGYTRTHTQACSFFTRISDPSGNLEVWTSRTAQNFNIIAYEPTL